MWWNNDDRISPDELRELMQKTREGDYVLLDVRQPGEYKAGHIPGAKLIPLPEVEARLGELDRDKEHVVYCHSGGRSRLAARLIADGIPDLTVHDLAGGMLAWNGLSVPDTPRVAVFEGPLDTTTLLISAMDLEKAAHDLYQTLLDEVRAEPVCALMHKLVGLELAHAKVLYHRLAELSGPEPLQPFETMFAELPGEVLEGGRSVQDLGPWIAAARSGGCMEFAELALEIETHAFDLYRAMAHETSAPADEALRTLFLDLAQQEKQHARLILDSLDSFVTDTD